MKNNLRKIGEAIHEINVIKTFQSSWLSEKINFARIRKYIVPVTGVRVIRR